MCGDDGYYFFKEHSKVDLLEECAWYVIIKDPSLTIEKNNIFIMYNLKSTNGIEKNQRWFVENKGIYIVKNVDENLIVFEKSDEEIKVGSVFKVSREFHIFKSLEPLKLRSANNFYYQR